nr:class I SAM-dependent methyltransferase [Actinotalea solisilvae]
MRGAGFRPARIEALLGPLATGALDREQTLPALRVARRAGEDPLAVLVRLFLCGDEVTRAEVDAALPGVRADGALRLGLVDAAGSGRGDAVRAVVDLAPVTYESPDGAAGEWFVASDLGEATTGAALRPDHVLGVGGASTTLARATIRTPRRRALDLGTGCGIQALYAATHSDEVVATDVSERALAFARFNAALAGVDLDLRLGSMLEPVADGGFDLVVSNPPFVITPRTRPSAAQPSAGLPLYEYRDGGRAGDDLVRDLVTDVGSVLAPGGVAQLLGNWEHRRGEPWQDRVGAWLDRAGLDAWVVQREVLDPAEYAETWLRDGGATADRDAEGWAGAYGAWLDDFAARDVEAVGFGMLVLRRPSGDSGVTLRRLEERTAPLRRPLGEHLASSLAAHDWLEAHDDAAVLATRLAVAPDITEERHLRPGADDPMLVLLRQGGGFGRTVRAGTGLAGLVGACDGELAVGRLVGALASLLDVGAAELGAELLPQVRDLVRDGFLVPVEPA